MQETFGGHEALPRSRWISVARHDFGHVEVDAGAYPAIYTADGWVVEATSAKWDVTLTVTGVRDEDGLRQRLAAVDPEFKHGDDLVAYADRLLAQRWEGRWPKRPAWLAKRLHGDRPPHV